jgi:integrase
VTGAIKANTVRDYEKEFDAFQMWREKHDFERVLPAPECQVASFLESVACARGPGCAGKALAAITKIHLFRNRPLPKSQLLKAMAKAFDQQKKRNSNPDQADPLPPAAVVALWEEWTEHRVPFAIECLVVTFLAGMAVGLRADKRGAELVKLDLRDVSEGANGQITISFRDIKNMPAGMVVPIEPVASGGFCPCAMLRVQRAARDKVGAGPNDPFFVTMRGKRTRSAFWTIAVQAAIDAAVRKGIMRKDGKWSSRSLRAGGATALQRLGYGELEAQALGGWKSKALYYYLRRQALADKKLSTHMFALTNK